MLRVLTILAAMFLGVATVTGCTAPSGAGSTAPAGSTAGTAWSLAVSNATFSSDVNVGDPIMASVAVTNTGSATNPGTTLQVNDLDAHADFQGCTPGCTSSTLLGFSADFAGIGPGTTSTLQLTFIAKSVGVANWSVCLYDTADPSARQVWCGQAQTTIH
jgi:hypothetical protein